MTHDTTHRVLYKNMTNTNKTIKRGFIMILALVFGAIFLTVFTGLSGYVLSENNFEIAKQAQNEASVIADAGLEYYRWHLAHFPGDLQNGTGVAGPYVTKYFDPQGGQIGSYSLNIAANQSCGQTTSVDISSTGTVLSAPGVSKTLVARYAKPTVSQYAYIVNSSVWAGPGRIINGPYHSNGGVRMDGKSNAPVTSSQASWLCTNDFGCSTDTTEPGVFGAGTNSNLWKTSTPSVDFNAIAANFSSLKLTAQSDGLYFPKTVGGLGYSFIFNGDGTVTVNEVTSVVDISSVSVSNPYAFTADSTLINTQTLVGTYTIPSNCALIYAEDNVWVSGNVTKKVTLVSANIVDTGVVTNVVLNGDIKYASEKAGLTVIGQNDVLISADAPYNMTLDGIFIAQEGAFGRNYYDCTTYPNYSQKGTLTVIGTIVSNKRTGTKWSGAACGLTYSSGYANRISSFDRLQSTNPPPFTPVTSSNYRFTNWRQK